MSDTKWVEGLLRELGKERRLYGALTEQEIDTILAAKPDITISLHFRERALEAMRRAQEARKKRLKGE